MVLVNTEILLTHFVNSKMCNSDDSINTCAAYDKVLAFIERWSKFKFILNPKKLVFQIVPSNYTCYFIFEVMLHCHFV